MSNNIYLRNPTPVAGLVPDLVKRADTKPSSWPYDSPMENEFSYYGWNAANQSEEEITTERANAEKLHKAFWDINDMMHFALQEIDTNSDIFKRWFDEDDAGDVKRVFLRMYDPDGIDWASARMKDWVCVKEDAWIQCANTSLAAYSVYQEGYFHFCPTGLSLPTASDLLCTDLDGYSSQKIRSVAFLMLHEAM